MDGNDQMSGQPPPRDPPRPRDPFDRTLDRLTSALNRARPISASPSDPIGTTRPCPDCGEPIELREVRGPTGRAVRCWSDCRCWRARIERAASLSQASAAQQAAVRGAPTSRVGDYRHMTMAAFNPALLIGGFPLVRQLESWLARVVPAAQCAEDYRTPATCALWFYSAGRGRGKTHLAAALALAAREAERLVAIVDELNFVNEYWAASLEARPELVRLPAEQAHLTVYDDIGVRENTPAGLRDAWYALISPRWLGRRWAIFTSNFTPDELAARGTIDDRVYSRIMQMTQGRVVAFDGSDQRLVF